MKLLISLYQFPVNILFLECLNTYCLQKKKFGAVKVFNFRLHPKQLHSGIRLQIVNHEREVMIVCKLRKTPISSRKFRPK